MNYVRWHDRVEKMRDRTRNGLITREGLRIRRDQGWVTWKKIASEASWRLKTQRLKKMGRKKKTIINNKYEKE